MPDPGPLPISQHITRTYAMLRGGIGVIAVGLPLVLVLGGLAQGVDLQDSISAYYHAFLPTLAQGARDVAGQGVMRNWFVGILWAIGVFLILYRGYGRRENVALNVAGSLLVVVAMVPMGWTCGAACPRLSVHGAAAVLFFLSIAYVCLFRSGDTLLLIEDLETRERYRRWYRVIGVLMIGLPLAVVVLERVLSIGSRTVILVEWVGIWTFAAYWLLKTWEIWTSDADDKAVRGLLVRAARKPGWRYLFDSTPLTPVRAPGDDPGHLGRG